MSLEPAMASVEIRGVGPVGYALALALHASGRPVVLAGRPAGAAIPTGRPIALSQASRLILERLGAWDPGAATPIRTVQVSRQRAFGRTTMTAHDAGVPALGYVVDYADILDRLHRAAIAAGISPGEARDAPALVVHAEGSPAGTAERDYGQDALLALVDANPGSGDIAFERFTDEGPLGLLPLKGRYCAVWGMRPERAQALMDADEATFLSALAEAAGRRAGRFVRVSGRQRIPLLLRRHPARVGEREAWVGNAAQTLHPVAGQGLNLGLRDAWDLACVLSTAPDPGDPLLLRRFAASRRCDAAATIRITDLLARGFVGDDLLHRAAGGLGLAALDLCAPARRFFARRMIYGPSALP